MCNLLFSNGFFVPILILFIYIRIEISAILLLMIADPDFDKIRCRTSLRPRICPARDPAKN